MSYGRSPYYIFGTRGPDGRVVEFNAPNGSIERGEFIYPCMSMWNGHVHSVSLPVEALEQFIAQVAARGTEELQGWIDRGAALDSDYTGFNRNHPDPEVWKEELEARRWLRTKVKVRRRGRKVK